MPQVEFPFVQRIYGFYGKADAVENVHLASEGHDYGANKRLALYSFLAKHFKLDLKKVQDKSGKIDESTVMIEKFPAMYVFGEKGEKLPSNAIRSFEELEKVFAGSIKR